MSGHLLGASEQADTSSSNNGNHEPEHPLIILSSRFLDQGDSFILFVHCLRWLPMLYCCGHCSWKLQ
ncbi:MAG: hypothetical protein ACJ795_12425 [Ktedonobacteraceae bacterium]